MPTIFIALLSKTTVQKFNSNAFIIVFFLFGGRKKLMTIYLWTHLVSKILMLSVELHLTIEPRISKISFRLFLSSFGTYLLQKFDFLPSIESYCWTKNLKKFLWIYFRAHLVSIYFKHFKFSLQLNLTVESRNLFLSSFGIYLFQKFYF